MPHTQKALNTTSPLPAHEVCKVLTDVALGKRIMMRRSSQSWVEIYHGLMPVEIDGWQLTLFNDCDTWITVSTAGRLMAESGHLNSGNATGLILSTY